MHRKSSPEPFFDKPDDDDEDIEFTVMDDDVEVMDSTGRDDAPTGTRDINKHGSKKRIGEQLVEMGVITGDQLNVALQEKKITGKMIGEVLVDLGFIDAETLGSYLAQASGVQVFDPKTTILDSEALALIKKPMAL